MTAPDIVLDDKGLEGGSEEEKREITAVACQKHGG